MSAILGPFAVFIKRTPDGWWRVTGLYMARQSRGIARSCAGHHKRRADAVISARVVLG